VTGVTAALFSRIYVKFALEFVLSRTITPSSSPYFSAYKSVNVVHPSVVATATSTSTASVLLFCKTYSTFQYNEDKRVSRRVRVTPPRARDELVIAGDMKVLTRRNVVESNDPQRVDPPLAFDPFIANIRPVLIRST
jgi:hypothetical protein